jgi:type IV fimbrial biogenesis protein FimT
MWPLVLNGVSIFSKEEYGKDMKRLYTPCRDTIVMMTTPAKVVLTEKMPIGDATGFTLIELMVTLVIVGIIATIGIPAFNGIINSNRLQAPANEVLAAMNFARTEAIRRNSTVIVCKGNTTLSGCTTGTSDWSALLVMDTNTTGTATNVLRVVAFDSQLKVHASIEALRYTSQGFIRNATNDPLNGTIRICIAKNQPVENARNLSFASGGRLNISSAALSGTCPTVS